MGLQFSFGLIQHFLVLLLQSTLPVPDLTTQLFELIVQILVCACVFVCLGREMIILSHKSLYLSDYRQHKGRLKKPNGLKTIIKFYLKIFTRLHCHPDVLHSGLCLPSSSAVADPPTPPLAGPLPAASQPALAPSCQGHAVAFGLQAPWHGVHPVVGPALFAFPLIDFGAPLLPEG